VDLTNRVIDIDEHAPLIAVATPAQSSFQGSGQQAGHQPHQGICVEPDSRGIARWRRTSRSSMLSAPATMPAKTAAVFADAFGEATSRCSSASSCRPPDSVNNIPGTRPTEPTRFGSSKTGGIL
jgi:hypothetical protein